MIISDYPPIFFVYAVTAITLQGVAKAGFGAGAAVPAPPLLSVAIPVIDAAALLLALLIICGIFSVLYYRNRYDRQCLKGLLPGAITGIALGAFFFCFFPGNQHILKTGIGILAMAFVLHQVVTMRPGRRL